jgi:hypothetical protein
VKVEVKDKKGQKRRETMKGRKKEEGKRIH